ncbi:MAG: hypothetical protein R3F49_16710 [Planctomycetota bacterium]
MLVHPATPGEADTFFGERWPEVPAIADPEHTLYHAFGLGRGTLWQLLGPKVWGAGLRALSAGNSVGVPKGDPAIMSGAFLIVGRRITWRHVSEHSGDIVSADMVPRPSGGAA